MKITYLNPENVSLDKLLPNTRLCVPEDTTNKEKEFYIWGQGQFSKYKVYGAHFDVYTFATEEPLPANYFFSVNNDELDYDDVNYQKGVEKAFKEGKTIQYRFGGWFTWPPKGTGRLEWDVVNYRIHPKHAAEYGIIPNQPNNSGNNKVIKETQFAISDEDLKSFNFWNDKEKQEKLCIEWFKNPDIKLDRWNKDRWKLASSEQWFYRCVYRPHLDTQQEKDNQAFNKWFAEKANDCSRVAYSREAWVAGVAYARRENIKKSN